jgi:hypothetical protein
LEIGQSVEMGEQESSGDPGDVLWFDLIVGVYTSIETAGQWDVHVTCKPYRIFLSLLIEDEHSWGPAFAFAKRYVYSPFFIGFYGYGFIFGEGEPGSYA